MSTSPDAIDSAVRVATYSGITSAAPAAFYGVPEGAAVAAYPTAAGTATVYCSVADFDSCRADVAAADFSSARWEAWDSGAVSARTVDRATVRLSCVAIKVASGTWTFEVAR